MKDDSETDADDVTVSMEIVGPYDDVLTRLKREKEGRDVLEPFVHDVELVLTTIEKMGAGTRSAIAENLPDEMIADYDAEAVVDLLQVAKRYDLVVLEGNTWKLGPKVRD